jgi:flavin-dependent dehydrogenase
VQGARREYDTFRSNPVDAYTRELRSRLAFADLLGSAVIAEPLRGTAALPTFFRTASGPGWALVGDAGHHKDPLIARGSPTHSATRTSLHRPSAGGAGITSTST